MPITNLSNNYFSTGLKQGLSNSIYSPLSAGVQGATQGAQAATQSGLFGKMGNFLGSSQFGNIAGGIGAVGGIIQAIGGWDSARKSLKEQKRMNSLLERQYNEEVKRYNDYKAERDKTRDIINDSAKYYKV